MRDASALVVVDLTTYAMTIAPNITFVSAEANDGAILVITSQNVVGAFDLNSLSYLWTSDETTGVLNTFSDSANLLVAGDVGVVLGLQFNVGTVFLSFDMTNGGMLVNVTEPGVNEMFHVVATEGFLVLSYANESQRVWYNSYNPLDGQFIAREAIPGDEFYLIPASSVGATTAASIFAISGQGYTHCDARTLKVLSYNLNLPSGLEAYVMPNVPLAGNTTVILLQSNSSTAILL
jgi:hypothetical protein